MTVAVPSYSVAAFLPRSSGWFIRSIARRSITFPARADSLAFFFACGSWLLYTSAVAIQTRTAIRCLVFFLAAFSLLSRALAPGRALPLGRRCSFVICSFSKRQRHAGRSSPRFWPVCSWSVATQPCASCQNSAPPRSRLPPAGPRRFVRLSMARALGDYTRLMVWPANLHMERTVFDPASLQSSRELAAGGRGRVPFHGRSRRCGRTHSGGGPKRSGARGSEFSAPPGFSLLIFRRRTSSA